MERRTFLRVAGLGSVSLAGCINTGEQSETASSGGRDGTTKATTLTEWKRATDCDGMHDSVIEVEQVESSLGEGFAPIRFDDLSAGERRILRTVTEQGGYGTCDAGDSFDQFLGRVVDHVDLQDGEMQAYLERQDTYYGLYVEDLDEVYSF